MQQPGRTFTTTSSYRYGFNGQEKSTEIDANGNLYNAEFWEYDSRSVRRWNLDPKPSVGISQYSAFSNNPIWFSDALGDTSVIGAGGIQRVEIDEKQNSLEFYKRNNNYALSGTKTNVPVQPGELRSFTNALGTFSATWTTDASGKPVFSGYKNDKGQDLNAAVKSLNEFASSFVGKFAIFGQYLQGQHDKDPVAFNLKLTTTLLSMSALAEVESVNYFPGYNPSVTTQESMSGIGFVKTTNVLAEGSFSIVNWQGYPVSGFKPGGPFRMLEGAEYASARALANKTNAAIHRSAPYLKGLEIHEIIPVKFGGSPTAPANKIFLTPAQHAEYSNFWRVILGNMKQ